MVWQGIVGDPGERGASGEKGKAVGFTEELLLSFFIIIIIFMIDLIKTHLTLKLIFMFLCLKTRVPTDQWGELALLEQK